MKIKEARNILEIYAEELKNAPCSKDHHLNKVGGLLEHLINTGIAAQEIDKENEQLYALATIHDIGKARTYKIIPPKGKRGKIKIEYTTPAVDHLINTIAMIAESGYHLSQEELHVLQSHHGGWGPFSRNANLTELAIKLHAADMLAMSREDNNDHSKK